MARESALEVAKELMDRVKREMRGVDIQLAMVAAVIALADQQKRIADAMWKKLGQENKANNAKE